MLLFLDVPHGPDPMILGHDDDGAFWSALERFDGDVVGEVVEIPSALMRCRRHEHHEEQDHGQTSHSEPRVASAEICDEQAHTRGGDPDGDGKIRSLVEHVRCKHPIAGNEGDEKHDREIEKEAT